MVISTFLAISLGASIKAKVVAVLFSILPIGAVAFALYQLVKRFTTLVDAIKNPWVHRAIVFAIALGLTALGAATGVDISCVEGVNCLNELSQDKIELILKSVLGSVSAFVLHAVKGSRR